MELFKCYTCEGVFPKKYFHRKRASKSGLSPNCRSCANKAGKRYREAAKLRDEPSNYLTLVGVRKGDYCKTYEFLETLGYDLYSEKSIHEQFCLKYGLKFVDKGSSIDRQFKPQDCQKKTPTN